MGSIEGEKTALVVAHPDDEILWFSSIMDKVDRILICFLDVPSRQDWTQGRRRATQRFPLANVEFIGLTESETFNGADWSVPVSTDYGLEVRRRAGVLPGFDDKRYRDNFNRLLDELGRRLQGCTRVFTHNPWGEYGHEEHVQVYRAVSSLKPRLGYEVLFSNYCSSRSYALMLEHIRGFTSDYQTVETNPELAKRIEQLYRESGCWTWPFDDYTWFTHECFMKDAALAKQKVTAGHGFPLNFIKIDTNPAADTGHGAARRFIGAVRRPFAAIRRAVRRDGATPRSLAEQ